MARWRRMSYDFNRFFLAVATSLAVCLPICKFNEYLLSSALPHTSHMWYFEGFVECFAATWRFRPSFWRNRVPQWSHLNGFSPVSKWNWFISNKSSLRLLERAVIKKWLKLTPSHMKHQRFALSESFVALRAFEWPFTSMNKLWEIDFHIMNKRILFWGNLSGDHTICDLSDPFWVKELPQTLHTYGLRPSWVILCRVKLVRVLNTLLQTSQRLSAL